MITIMLMCVAVIGIAFLAIVLVMSFKDTVRIRAIQWDDVLISIVLIGLGYLVGWVFYRERQLSIAIGLLSVSAIVYYRRWKAKRTFNQVIDEFIEINRMLISELHAGKSIERAYRSIYSRLANNADNYHVHMKALLADWINQFDLGRSMNDVLADFAKQYPDESIVQFVNMFDMAIVNGSSLLDVIELTDRMIKERRAIEGEISVLIAQKKLEQLVISLAPLLLLYMMQSTSYDFVAPLYETAMGRILMTAALITFVGCFIWSKHMTEIDI